MDNISLSSSSIIESAVLKSTYDFSATVTAGNLVNNRKFKLGFDDFYIGKTTKDAYVWKALSAIADDLGQSLYSNVAHYIDNVSNVDTCKIRSLKSMLYMVGLDYIVIDKVQSYPIEILSLIDILSMNKKYLFSNQYMQLSFIDALLNDGILHLSNAIDEEALSSGNISSTLDLYLFDTNVFNSYLSSTYYNFMYDMLNMDIVPADLLETFVSLMLSSMSSYMTEDLILEGCKAYNLILLSDGYGPNATIGIDRYALEKSSCNIDKWFDVDAIVDLIEVGLRSIDEFDGDRRRLLLQEIDNRKSIVSLISSIAIPNLLARNAYYRKKKTIEYAKFVDMLNNSSSDDVSAYEIYKYDPSYYLNPSPSLTYVLDRVGEPGTSIVDAYVKNAALSLVHITNYINKIREVIRLLVRKVFMKGTNNLLEYTVNEFLIDYANLLKSVFSEQLVSTIVGKLSAHSINNVFVLEYWDTTEYFNISASTSNRYAMNYGLVNPRYFDETFKMSNGRLVPEENNTFTNDEINDFYLSSLGLKNSLFSTSAFASQGEYGLSSSFYDFLSVLFDIAANPSYYDLEHNVFGTQLSNLIITYNIYDDLSLIKLVDEVVTSAAAKAQYQFDERLTVRQLKDGLFESLANVLQEEYLSGVSATYDLYYPLMQLLSSSLDSERFKLSTYLNDTYSHYFCKSKNSYSYGPDGLYLFYYFIGNDNYLTDDYYIVTLNLASSWITEHCHTYSLSNAILMLSSNYLIIKSNIYNSLVDNLAMSGFIDLRLDDLSEEMDTIKSFLNKKIDARTDYLQLALENLRQLANELKGTYDTLVASFLNVLASMPDTTQGFYMKYVGYKNGEYKMSDEVVKLKDDDNEKQPTYDLYSNAIYVIDDKGSWNKVLFDSSNDILANGYLVDNINKAIARIDECKDIYYGAMEKPTSSGVNRAYGTLKSTLNLILADLSKLGSLHDAILDQASLIYLLDSSKVASLYVSTDSNASIDMHAKILELIKFLGTSISEVEFAKDLTLSSYNSHLSGLTNISAEYIPARNEYEVLWSAFLLFLLDFDKTSDYKVFKPSNIEKLDTYRRTKDAIALGEIQEAFSKLYSTYYSLVDSFTTMCELKIMLYKTTTLTYVYTYTGDVLEECIVDFINCLVKDILMKETIGNEHVESDLEYVASFIDIVSNGERINGLIGLFLKYFKDELGSNFSTASEYEAIFDNLYRTIPSIILLIIDLLEYTKYGSFAESKIMFLNYTGIASKTISVDLLVAEDPYYNYKNLTHPSYLIHPFLWNFVEKSPIQLAIDAIAASFANIDFEWLEGYAILTSLDSILGKFGNLIDVWKSHVKDFTSYLTRYEQSGHISRYTNIYSEVVDYDGAFYPPALESYLYDPSLSSMSKWLSHLNLSASGIAIALMESNMATYYSLISSIALPKDLSDVNDIYKYLIDAFGNMYTLYKTYQCASPSEVEKRLTIGLLWIRLADTPLSFPLTAVCDLGEGKLTDSYQWLSSMLICDFEIFPSKKKIALAYVDLSNGIANGLTFVIALDIVYSIYKECGVGNLKLMSNPIDSNVVYLSYPFPKDIVIDRSLDIRYWQYAGMFANANGSIDGFFIEHAASGTLIPLVDKGIPDNPRILIHNEDGMSHSYSESIIKLNGVVDIKSNEALVSRYLTIDGVLMADIAFVVDAHIDETIAHRATKSISVDLSSSIGATFENPIDNDMNSFDIFNLNVLIARLNLEFDALSPRSIDGIDKYLTNSDMGYRPSYAGLSVSGPLDIKEEIDACHLPIELLGKSKNLDILALAVNGLPDPYLTKDEIYDKYMFGRAYENGHGALSTTSFDYSLDKSLVMFENAAFYLNMPYVIYDNALHSYNGYGAFMWTIPLTSFKASDLLGIKLLMYTTKSFGKNPYIIEDLSVAIEYALLLPDEWLDAEYDLNKPYVINDCKIALDDVTLLVVSGTLNGVNEVDAGFSNTIDNIKSIQYRYFESGGTPSIAIRLNLIDSSIPSFISSRTIKVALVNKFDVSFFEWLHIIDDRATQEDAIAELGRMTGNPFTSELMWAIDLGLYNALSDVQIDKHKIFLTYYRMAFKLGEESIWPLSSFNYYIPSINIKYPLNFAQVYDENYIAHAIDPSALIHIFNQDEVYVFDVQDTSSLCAIGTIIFKLDGMAKMDGLRVYEDYFYYDLSTGKLNSLKYTCEDPYMFLYVHLAGEAVDIALHEHGIDVPESECSGVAIDFSTTASDKFSAFLLNSGISSFRSEQYDDGHASQYSEFDIMDIDADDREHLLEMAAGFLKIYMNYKKSSNGITLYANYLNFINSPFLKIVDGKPYIDTIDRTYAIILPGDSLYLDIVLLFRQYANGSIVGVNNVIVATYLIFNLSDDKPKFLLKKVSDIASNATSIEDHVDILLLKYATIYEGQLTIDNPFEYFAIASKTSNIDKDISCLIGYPLYLVQLDESSLDSRYAYVPEGSIGLVMLVFNLLMLLHNLVFTFKQGVDKYIDKLSKVTVIDILTDSSMEISHSDGYILLLSMSS